MKKMYIIIVFVLVIIFALGYYWYLKKQASDPVPSSTTSAAIMIDQQGQPSPEPNLENFANLKLGTPFSDIVHWFGEPKAEIGSGLYIYVYDLLGGNQVRLGFADLNSLMYVNLSATGIALNTKGYSAVDIGGEIVFLKYSLHTARVHMQTWPDNINGKKVKITGTITKEYFSPQPEDGPQSQSLSGDAIFMTDPDWALQKINKINKSTEYKSKVKYSQGQELTFPDFTIIYIGSRTLPNPYNAEWVIVYYDFEIRSSNTKQKISWSSGTGEIAPTPFMLDDKNFSLEKAFSREFGKLDDNELVINQELN